jgi:hypothetical protein
MREQGKREDFFFVKKKQKTFICWGTGVITSTAQTKKSFFASFFTKTEHFCPSLFWKQSQCPY